MAVAALPRCPFKFGTAFRPANAHAFAAADYLTAWAGSYSARWGNGFNPSLHGRMLDAVRAQPGRKLAVFYAYIIAFLARRERGLRDCDVGEPSLCVHGADFIRLREQRILALYDEFANATAARLGGTDGANVVWLLEPDFHQYAAPSQAGGGPLSQPQMVGLLRRIVGVLRRRLPACRVSLDVSPWLSSIEAWLAPFLADAELGADYLHTSGGRTTAAAPRVRSRRRDSNPGRPSAFE